MIAHLQNTNVLVAIIYRKGLAGTLNFLRYLYPPDRDTRKEFSTSLTSVSIAQIERHKINRVNNFIFRMSLLLHLFNNSSGLQFILDPFVSWQETFSCENEK